MGGADLYVKRRIKDFRDAAVALIADPPPFNFETLANEQRRLAERLRRYGDCRDSTEIWRRAGIPDPERVNEIEDDAFLALPHLKEAGHDAR
jgi:malonate decarboxylase beta subunit